MLYTGPLQCFCKEEKKRKHSISMEYELIEKDQVAVKEPICYNVQQDKYWSSILGISISFIIVAVNVILKLSVTLLVEWIGDDLVSMMRGRLV